MKKGRKRGGKKIPAYINQSEYRRISIAYNHWQQVIEATYESLKSTRALVIRSLNRRRDLEEALSKKIKVEEKCCGFCKIMKELLFLHNNFFEKKLLQRLFNVDGYHIRKMIQYIGCVFE